MYSLTADEKDAVYRIGRDRFVQYTISAPDIPLTITNDTIHMESVKIKKAISGSDDLQFGGCIASSFEFEVSEVLASKLKNQMFSVSLNIVDTEDNTYLSKPMPIGVFFAETVELIDDKDYKRVIGYDALYSASEDCTDWYKEFMEENENATIGDLRKALLNRYNISFVSQSLPNDSVVIKTDAESISQVTGQDLLRMCCELHGGFGFINRTGKFEILWLSGDAVFPSDTLYPQTTLYPAENYQYIGSGTENNATYRKVKYDESDVAEITCIQFLSSSGYLACTIGSDTTNSYIISGNVLTYGMTEDELYSVGNALLGSYSRIIYRPCEITMKSMLFLDLGDYISLLKDTESISTFITEMETNGIQGAIDTITSKGNEYRENEKSQQQLLDELASRTQEDIDELESNYTALKEETEEFEERIEVEMEALEESILMRVAKYSKDWDLSGEQITMFGYGAPEVILPIADSGTLYLDQETGIIYRYQPTNAPQELWWVFYKQCELTDAEIESKIEVTSNAITSEVTRASNEERNLSSRIEQTEKSWALQLTSDDDIVTAINASTESIELLSNRLIVQSKNFTLDRSGNATFSGALNGASGTFSGALSGATGTFSGSLKAASGTFSGELSGATGNFSGKVTANSGKIGSFDIDSSGNLVNTAYGTRLEKDTLGANNGKFVTTKTSSLLPIGSEVEIGASYSDKVSIKGNLYAPNNAEKATSSATANCIINSTTGHIGRSTASSKRYKHDIEKLSSEELKAEKLYDLPVCEYVYNTDYLSNEEDTRYNKKVVGFIAEDVEKIYPIATEHTEDGIVENWNERYIVPPMLKLIQEQHKEIEELKKELSLIKDMLKGE